MADPLKTPMTCAEYEAQLVQASLAAVTRSRELLAKPIYPYDFVPPDDPFDFSGLKIKE